MFNSTDELLCNQPDLTSKQRVDSVQPVVKVAIIRRLQKKTAKLRCYRECIAFLHISAIKEFLTVTDVQLVLRDKVVA